VASTWRDTALLARVARLYYLDECSKSDIADRLKVSRFRVARLLEAARREGVVTIHIAGPAGVDAELSAQLRETFRLAHAVVVEHEDDDVEALRLRLGRAAAEVVQDVVTTDDVLGLAWARSLRGMAQAITSIAACPVVQLTGAMSRPDGSDVLDLVRRVAQTGGGTPHVFYAPLVAPDAASARTIRRQPEVAGAFELANRATVAVVGIGAWQSGLSTIYDMVEPAARQRAATLGTIGEISGALIDEDGKAITGPLSRRIIGVTAEQLRGAQTVISVAYGLGKTEAVHAALRGGLITGLITHTELARELLAGEPASGAHDAGTTESD